MIKKIKMNKRKKPVKLGFTLIEIIVVLFVVSLGMIGVLSLIIQNIQGENINKNSIAAYQLAQEGVELIRKTRDTNWKNSVAFNQGLSVGSYYMSYLDTTPNPLTNDSQGNLYKNSNGFYVHDSGTLTKFNRIIEITAPTAYSMIVRSQVSWEEHNQVYSYEVDTALFDWLNP